MMRGLGDDGARLSGETPAQSAKLPAQPAQGPVPPAPVVARVPGQVPARSRPQRPRPPVGTRSDWPLMTPAEVAAVLHVDANTLARWSNDGKLTAVRTPGGHRRYLRVEVLNLVRPRVAWPSSPAPGPALPSRTPPPRRPA